MSTLTAAWHSVPHLPPFTRSSHILCVLHSSLHLFSGEQEPRVPLSAELHILPLNPAIPIAITVLASPSGPPPRIGAASAVLNDTLYVFGGFSGLDLGPLEEGGRVWSFVAGGHTWTPLDPSDENDLFPEARGHHAAAAGTGKIYIHSGSSTSGKLGDLWSFDIVLKKWQRLADAPGNGREGVAIAVTGARELWRFGGCCENARGEEAVDVYDILNDTWRSIPYSHGPPTRLASCLVPIKHPKTRRGYLVTAFGQRDPSILGEGRFLGDVWVYDIETAEWSEVKICGDKMPEPRSWFVAGTADADDGQGVVLQGGVGVGGRRFGDWWLLLFE